MTFEGSDRPVNEGAIGIAERILHMTGEALMTGDFDLFRSCFWLPQFMGTFSGRTRIETVDDLRDIFDGVRSHFTSIGATDLVRRCIDASFRNENTIISMHESRLLSDEAISQDPYFVLSTLQNIGGWKITFSQYAISGSEYHDVALTGKMGHPKPDE